MMITCHKSRLEQRCRERGYSIQEVMPCVVNARGDIYTIDTEHEAYPSKRTGGPGTELSKILSSIGINPKERGCSCKSRAKKMDKEGIAWCEENIETIVTWLQEEAARRRLPFLRAAGKLLVKKAIRNSRRSR